MITLLHGENILKSRQALVSLLEKARNEGVEVVTFGGQKTGLAEVKNALQSGSLLGKNRLVIIENLLSASRSKEKEKILAYLAKAEFDNDLILWEERELKNLPTLPKVDIQLFKLKPLIFRFLESLRPGNHEEMLRLLQEVKTQEEPEMIFYMLIRQLRYLFLAKDQAFVGLPDWQKRKLASQARHFRPDQLQELYQKLLEIDFSQKTSSDPYPLSSRLDLLVASL